MRLQEKLDAFTAGLLKSGAIPQDIVEMLFRATADLVASKKAEQALKAGQPAPAFRLKDADDNIVDSSKLLASGPLVVTFYRGVWCPYCNIDLKALEEARADIGARGASLVALSMQNAANSRKSVRDNGLSYPILIDRHGAVAAEFGLRYALSPKIVGIYRDVLNNNLELFNDDVSWNLPMPARYIIAQDGVIAYAEVNPDFTRRPDPCELFPVLDQLARTKAS
jgi:peroxiredoxin